MAQAARGTEAELRARDLQPGEVGIASDTDRVFIGTGNNPVDGADFLPAAAFAQAGFADYNDDALVRMSPLVLPMDTWVRITNNGLGPQTNLLYLPSGVTSLMNLAGYIDPTELNLGDVLFLRNDFTVTPSTNNALLRLRYTLGTGGSSYTLEQQLGRLDAGSGIDYRFALSSDLIYMGDDNTRNNVIGIEMNLSTPGTLINSGTVITVLRH